MGRYVKFDQDGYMKTVRRAIMDELQYLEPYIENSLRTRLGAVQWRSVDAKYKTAALHSIKAVALDRARNFIMSIGGGGKDPWDGWNMARKGRDMFQRPNGNMSKINEHRKLPDQGFGREIELSQWFAYGLNDALSMFDEAVRRAVKSVPIATYIDIERITKRM
ncbi:hypothetical protein [Paenibacillus sp. NPDC057967]|uniref:hypothetical protein n=1 Tax=Paenibacillus sp. NPDC057967 TaxID=3346293 RepID=UPI0036D797A8